MKKTTQTVFRARELLRRVSFLLFLSDCAFSVFYSKFDNYFTYGHVFIYFWSNKKRLSCCCCCVQKRRQAEESSLVRLERIKEGEVAEDVSASELSSLRSHRMNSSIGSAHRFNLSNLFLFRKCKDVAVYSASVPFLKWAMLLEFFEKDIWQSKFPPKLCVSVKWIKIDQISLL